MKFRINQSPYIQIEIRCASCTQKGFTKRFNNWRNWVYRRGPVMTISALPINSHKDLNIEAVNMSQQFGPETPQKTYHQMLLNTA